MGRRTEAVLYCTQLEPSLKYDSGQVSLGYMSKIGVGVIGLGYSGINIHLKNYLKNPLCEVRGISDTDIAKSMAVSNKFHVDRVYTDFNDMLKRDDIDVVSISVPPAFHAKIAIRAMEEGKDVLCEKPFALSTTEARKVIAVEKKTGRKLMIGFVYRFFKPYVILKNLIDSEKFGDVITMKDSELLGFSDESKLKSWKPWLFNNKLTPGASFSESGSHIVDRMLWMINSDIVSISGAANLMNPNNVFTDLTSVGILNFKNNAIGEVVVSYQSGAYNLSKRHNRFFTEVNCTKGSLLLDVDKYYRNKECLTIILEGNEKSVKIPIGDEPSAVMINEFLKCIKSRAKPPTTSQDGLKSLEVVEAFYKSLKTKRDVKI